MKLLFCIGAGGFLGSISRYLLSRYIASHWDSAFPLATWIVNLSGCLLIGILIGLFARADWFTEGWRAALVIGFCCSFTTFSTFAGESLSLLKENAFGTMALYALSSFALGLLFVYVGVQIVQVVK